MSEMPPGVENPGYVKPGTGQTEKGEDRNESPCPHPGEKAPDGSTVVDPDDLPEEAS